MAEIILVRHGQANRHATDEAGYDRLSPLGVQQAEWLGAHFGQTNPHFDHVITGTLHRQTGTASRHGLRDHRTQDARLNELSYFAIAQGRRGAARHPRAGRCHRICALPAAGDGALGAR